MAAHGLEPGRGASHLRLRRRGLCGGRGAGRARRPRPRRPQALSGAPAAPHAVGPRRRGAEDPAGGSFSPGRLCREAAREERHRDQGLDDARIGRAKLRRPDRRRAHPVRTRSCGPPASARTHCLPSSACLSTSAGASRSTPTCESRSAKGLWALGDCAHVPNSATPGLPDPPTSQHALRQARRLAKNLRGTPKPYRYRSLGQVATLGRHKGIALVFGVPLRGFVGWFVTRSYHLYQLPLFSRKLRVVTDWTVSLLFRRDIAELSMLGHPRGIGDG